MARVGTRAKMSQSQVKKTFYARERDLQFLLSRGGTLPKRASVKISAPEYACTHLLSLRAELQ